MVKERRAFSTDTISADLPVETPNVGRVPVVSYEGNIEAAKARAGMWVDPNFMNTLARIPQTFGAMGVQSRMYDDDDARFQISLDNERYATEDARLRKREADLYLSNRYLELNAEITDTLNKAARDGRTSLRSTVQGLYDTYSKEADQLAKSSPYIGEQFTAYINTWANKAMPDAIKADQDILDIQNSALFNQTVSNLASNIATDNMTLDDAMNYLFSQGTGNLINQMPDEKDQENLLRGYQQLVLTEAARIKKAVAEGNGISVEAGRAKLSELIAKYGGRDTGAITMKLEMGDGRVREFPMYLEEDQIKAILNEQTTFKNAKMKKNAKYIADSWNKMVDSPGYSQYTDLEDVQSSYDKVIDSLYQEYQAGNEAAYDKMVDVQSKYYTEVYPKSAVWAQVRKIVSAKNGDISGIKDQLATKAEKLMYKVQRGDFSNMEDLVYVDPTTGTVTSYAFPENDAWLEAYAANTGVDLDTVKYNYYTAVAQTMSQVAETLTPEDIMNTNMEYGLAQNDLSMYLKDTSNFIIEDPSTGVVSPNQTGISTMVGLLQKNNDIRYGIARNTTTTPISSKLINDMYAKYKTLNTKQKGAFAYTMGAALRESGMADAFVRYKFPNATAEQQQMMNDIAMASFLNPAISDYETGLYNNIIDERIARGGSPVSSDGLNQIARDIDPPKGLIKSGNMGWDDNNFDSVLTRIYDKYNVPADFRPVLNYSFRQMAAAYFDPRRNVSEKDKKMFSWDMVDNIVQRSFTRRGTYKFSNALQGMNLEQFDNRMDSIEEQSVNIAKRLGIRGKISARIDYGTGMIEILQDGSPIQGVGVSKNGKIGFTGIKLYNSNMKPTNMSESAFNQAQDTLLTFAMVSAACTGVDTNESIQKFIDKYAPGTKQEDFKQLSYKMANAVANADLQRQYYEYMNGSRKESLATAPKEVRLAMSEIAADSFFYPGTRVNPVGGALPPALRVGYTVANALIGDKLPIDLPPLYEESSSNKGGVTTLGSIRNTVGQSVGNLFNSAEIAEGTRSYDRSKARKELSDRLGNAVDFFYTHMSDGNSVSLSVADNAKSAVPLYQRGTLHGMIASAGWKVTSDVDGKHVSGSKHYGGYALDIGADGGFQTKLDSKGNLKKNDFEVLWNTSLKSQIDQGNITQIINGQMYRQGLDKNSWMYKYVDYAKKKGVQILGYGRNPGDHDDHIHCTFKTQVVDPKTKDPKVLLNSNYYVYAGNNIMNAINNAGGKYGTVDYKTAQQASIAFYDYKPSIWDAKNLRGGTSASDLNILQGDPTLCATAALVKFRQGLNILGSNNVNSVLYGLGGAKYYVEYIPDTYKNKAGDLKKAALTLDQLITLLNGNPEKGNYRVTLQSTDKKYSKYINEWVRADRLMKAGV